jgi:hypothetical protein
MGCQGYCDDVLHHYAYTGSLSSPPLPYTGDHWHCGLYFQRHRWYPLVNCPCDWMVSSLLQDLLLRLNYLAYRAPINVSYDASSGNYSIAVTGWFVAVRQAYNEYYTYKIAGFSFDRQGTNTISFFFVCTHGNVMDQIRSD